MKSYFAINHNPDAKDLKQLSQKTGLPKRVLQVSISYPNSLFYYFKPNPFGLTMSSFDLCKNGSFQYWRVNVIETLFELNDLFSFVFSSNFLFISDSVSIVFADPFLA